MFIEAHQFCCVYVSNEEDQKRTKTKKEINAILSLDGSRVYTIVNDAGLNGVVFNCLPVKVNSTDGVVLYILSFFF